MRIGITGASGFLGRNLIRAAIRRGYEVIAFTRTPSRIVRDAIETRAFSLDAAPDFAGCEAIVHLAGENVAGLWTSGKVRRIRESRAQGTARVVEALRAHRPHTFVCASATGIYTHGGDVELTESALTGGSPLAEICLEWERAAFAAESTCRVVRARIGLVFGRDGGALPLMTRMFRLCLGGRLGSGAQWMPWAHVDDVVALLLFAVENMDIAGVMNCTAPWPARNADFTHALARAARRPAFIHVPAFALRLLLGQFARELLDSKRVVPAVATAAGYRFQFPELDPALRDALA